MVGLGRSISLQSRAAPAFRKQRFRAAVAERHPPIQPRMAGAGRRMGL